MRMQPPDDYGREQHARENFARGSYAETETSKENKAALSLKGLKPTKEHEDAKASRVSSQHASSNDALHGWRDRLTRITFEYEDEEGRSSGR